MEPVQISFNDVERIMTELMATEASWAVDDVVPIELWFRNNGFDENFPSEFVSYSMNAFLDLMTQAIAREIAENEDAVISPSAVALRPEVIAAVAMATAFFQFGWEANHQLQGARE